MNWICKMLSLIISFSVASLLAISCSGNSNVESPEQANTGQIKQAQGQSMERRFGSKIETGKFANEALPPYSSSLALQKPLSIKASKNSTIAQEEKDGNNSR